MAAFTLAPNSTWFTRNNSTIRRASITEIYILNTTINPTENTVWWDASEDNDGSVICESIGTELFIGRGSGTGKIYMNADASYMFYDLSDVAIANKDKFENVTILEGLENLDTSKATTFMAMFGHMKSLLQLNGMNNWDTSKVTSLRSTWTNCSALQIISGISNWDVRNVTSCKQAFNKCLSLTSLAELDGWKDKTHNITDMSAMFQGNSNAGDMKLINTGVENWDVSNVVYANHIFYGCAQLTSLDLNKWNTQNFWTISHLFADCRGLTDLRISKWNVSNIQEFDAAFNECSKLEELDLTGWRTTSARRFTQMFESCAKLKKIIGLENFVTTSIDSYAPFKDLNGEDMVTSYPFTVFYEMFFNCGQLEEIDLSSFDNSKAEGYQKMFMQCPKLKTIYVSDKWTTRGADYNPEWDTDIFTGCTSLMGEEGTVYDANNNCMNYARIDGENGVPGYFTNILNNPDVKMLFDTKILYDLAKTIRRKLGTYDKFKLSQLSDTVSDLIPDVTNMNPVAQIGDKTYPSVVNALSHAKAGDMVTMIANSTEDTIIIPSDVTLNLVNYHLTANKVIGLVDGKIIANAETAPGVSGRLYVPKDNFKVNYKNATSLENSNASVIPIWIENYYVFSLGMINLRSIGFIEDNTKIEARASFNFTTYIKKNVLSISPITNNISIHWYHNYIDDSGNGIGSNEYISADNIVANAMGASTTQIFIYANERRTQDEIYIRIESGCGAMIEVHAVPPAAATTSFALPRGESQSSVVIEEL